MRKKFISKLIIACTIMCTLFVYLSSCYSKEEKKYYSQKENYISVIGIVSHIKYNEDSTALYISFSNLSPSLDDTSFKIIGENLRITQINGIDNKLKIGEQIEFITAPKYFGDGYVMPIVAISINGESLLNFEEGYKNLLNWLS